MSRTSCRKNTQHTSTVPAGQKNNETTISVCGKAKLEYTDTAEDTHCCCSKKCNNKSTKIIAEVDVGFGNTLYIRGAGNGLSWEKGIALKNQDSNFWAIELPNCTSDFEYKLLINDTIWCTGDNFVAHCNEKNIITPNF